MKIFGYARLSDGQTMTINENGTFSWVHQKEDPDHLIYEYTEDAMECYVNMKEFIRLTK